MCLHLQLSQTMQSDFWFVQAIPSPSSAPPGLQISALEGHTALVTSVIVVPASSPASKILSYCWTASIDGTIRYWDFSVPELMKKIDVWFPIFSMVIPSISCQPQESNGKVSNIYAYVSTEATKVLHGQI